MGCGQLGCAKRVFDEIPERDLVSWNSIICGYSQFNRYKEVLHLLNLLQEADLVPDSVTMVKVLGPYFQYSEFLSLMPDF